MTHITTRLPFAGISTTGNATPTALTAVTLVQVVIFDTDDVSFDAIPDHTNDHITIVTPGKYFVMVSLSVLSGAGLGFELHGIGQINDGATPLPNLHFHRNFSGGGGDVGSMSMSGIMELAAGDTVELWVENLTNGTDILIEDVTMSVLLVGEPA